MKPLRVFLTVALILMLALGSEAFAGTGGVRVRPRSNVYIVYSSDFRPYVQSYVGPPYYRYNRYNAFSPASHVKHRLFTYDRPYYYRTSRYYKRGYIYRPEYSYHYRSPYQYHRRYGIYYDRGLTYHNRHYRVYRRR